MTSDTPSKGLLVGLIKNESNKPKIYSVSPSHMHVFMQVKILINRLQFSHYMLQWLERKDPL